MKTIFKKTIIILALIVTTVSINASELFVVTTLPSLASLTESLGGDKVEVFSITRGVQDAHYVEAKPSYMLKLNKADLLIYSGLELEIGWLPLLIQGARNSNVSPGSRGHLNASSALSQENLLEKAHGGVDRSMGDVHPAGNPHFLLNPHHTIEVCYLIADKLIELDPDNAAYYETRLDEYVARLDSKIAELESIANILKGKEVVCYHKHWSYLCDWLGINIAGYVEAKPGIPPTPRHKREIIKMMKRKEIKIVIISSWKEPKKAQEVADAVGADLIILPGEADALPGTKDYFSWMEYMISQLSKTAQKYYAVNSN